MAPAVIASRRVLAVWLALAALVAFATLGDGGSGGTASRERALGLFGFDEPDLERVELRAGSRAAVLLRDGGGRWLVHGEDHTHAHGAGAREHHVADPPRAAALAEGLGAAARTRADRRIRPERGLAAYGLDPPRATIAFYRRGATAADHAATLNLGDPSPSGFELYAQREGDAEILLVPRYFVTPLLDAALGAQAE